jgi:adenylate kinase
VLIILIGPPGSGKGTQGKLLAAKLNLSYLSTGDMLRKMVDSEEMIGKSLKNCMDSGKLIPVNLINTMVESFLNTKDSLKGCVLDGYPRTVEQAKFLDGIVDKSPEIIYFKIDDIDVLKRISGRINCSICKRNYNLYFDRPKIDNICDDCGASQFIHRKDDSEEIVEERLNVYRTETHPLINYYQNLPSFHVIDASKNKEEIASLLFDLLKRI